MKKARLTRRQLLQMSAGGFVWMAGGFTPAAASSYRVGVGKSTDAYDATRRAVAASGEWPFLRCIGKTVVIKPNLVRSCLPETGITTDPQVVRALVDLALEARADRVLIVEAGCGGVDFTVSGYGFFNGYHPRVQLVDMNYETLDFIRIPGGLTYKSMFLPHVLFDGDPVFISVAKLKTHQSAAATLSMKNLIGLAPIEKYAYPSTDKRTALHLRGLDQAIVDLNMARPIDFAVVDGIWGMEGNGPVSGEPLRMDMVVAGRNALAVDRVCLEAMGINQNSVLHLFYASLYGLGPQGLSGIEVAGDVFEPVIFRQPCGLNPFLTSPQATRTPFDPAAGQEMPFQFLVFPACYTSILIVRVSDLSPVITPVRLLQDWQPAAAGTQTACWDGRDDSGRLVPSGRYTIQVQACHGDCASPTARIAHSTRMVWVA